MQNYIFLITILKHIKLLGYDHLLITHRAIAVNGLSRLTKLKTSKGHAQPIRFENRVGQSLSNRMESDGRFELESNLEASQVSIFYRRLH